ncbi:hypothetical protein F2P81_011630 [Scophthalmus maximus]|uniref:Prostaglandin E synthase 3 n=1 Tax=Scophthalmus maximus TaxID=52904 RepID=A0A6A4SW66_SCOMX|nr:hypothetical protein F2P81_011630 [Scophthalmus maximus]
MKPFINRWTLRSFSSTRLVSAELTSSYRLVSTDRTRGGVSAGKAWQPAAAKWYDRPDCVFVEFCVEDSRDVQVKFDKSKIDFGCVIGTDDIKHENTLDLFGEIDPKCNWLSVDFNNWKDWEDDSDEDMSRYDKFSEMMNSMEGDDLCDLDEHYSADSDDECKYYS